MFPVLADGICVLESMVLALPYSFSPLPVFIGSPDTSTSAQMWLNMFSPNVLPVL